MFMKTNYENKYLKKKSELFFEPYKISYTAKKQLQLLLHEGKSIFKPKQARRPFV